MSTRSILEESIKDHQKAIDKSERDLDALEVTYSIGDRFKYGTSRKFMLSDSDKNNRIAMVGLNNGIRYNTSWAVGDVGMITTREMNGMLSYFSSFTRYWDARKGCKV